MRKFLIGVAALLFAAAALANNYSNPNGSVSQGFVPEDGKGNVLGGAFLYSNINTAATFPLKTGAGLLHSVCLNTVNATSTLQIYDNTAGSGTKIGLITQATGQQPGCMLYDIAFNTGLTLVATGGTPDYTVTYR